MHYSVVHQFKLVNLVPIQSTTTRDAGGDSSNDTQTIAFCPAGAASYTARLCATITVTPVNLGDVGLWAAFDAARTALPRDSRHWDRAPAGTTLSQYRITAKLGEGIA